MLNDDQIATRIRAVLNDQDKPADLLPIDILQTIRLLLEPYADVGIHISQTDLTEELACSRDSVARSQERLVAAGWLKITKEGKTCKVNRLTVTVPGIIN
jgi:hypothetical protein